MGTAKIVSCGEAGRRIEVAYEQSAHFDWYHYVHKYYLSPADKGILFPVDICALDILAWGEEDFIANVATEGWDGMIQKALPAVTLYYKNLGLEKIVDPELVRRGLMAITAYRKDTTILDLSPEEAYMAKNFNEWLFVVIIVT